MMHTRIRAGTRPRSEMPGTALDGVLATLERHVAAWWGGAEPSRVQLPLETSLIDFVRGAEAAGLCGPSVRTLALRVVGAELRRQAPAAAYDDLIRAALRSVASAIDVIYLTGAHRS